MRHENFPIMKFSATTNSLQAATHVHTHVINCCYVCSVCTRPGHLSFVDLSSHLVPMASILLVTRQAGDHMISTAISHDLRVISQEQAEQWLQKFLIFLHHV